MSQIRALPQPHRLAWRRIVVGMILLAGLIALLNLTGVVSQVRQMIPGLGAPAPTYQTTIVTRGNVAVIVTATGPVAAAQSVPVSFKNSGLLAKVAVTVGDKVKKGQVLGVLDNSDLQIALEQAQANLTQQQANLAKVEAGSTPQQIAVAQTSVANAKQAVGDAQASLARTQAGNAQDLAAAQDSAASAATNVAAAQKVLAATRDQAAKAIAADQLAIATAQKNLQAAQDQQASGLAADQTAIGNAQQALQSTQATVDANLPILEQNVAKAKATLWADQISRDSTCGHTSGAACQSANAAVAGDETAVGTAQASLTYGQQQGAQQIVSAQATLKSAQSALANDRAKFAASIVSAKNALEQAQATLASDQSKNNGSIVSAQNQVDAARAALHAAQTGVGQAQSKASQAAQSGQQAVTQAVSNQRTAEANYNQTAAPPLPTDIQAAKAAVANAQAAVDSARNNLDSATLVSPMDGTVATVNGAVGQWIQGGTTQVTNGASASANAFITLLDTNNLQVQAQVNEADISKVKIGDPATFAVQAYPNATFAGKVLEIQPVGTTVQNVVEYNVVTSIASTQDATLYPGMTATMTITSAQQDNVLTVPNTALAFAQAALRAGLVARPGNALPPTTTRTARAATPTSSWGVGTPGTGAMAAQTDVVTLTQGKLALVPVTPGLTDGAQTAITSGLSGDEVVVTGQTGAATSSGTANRGGGFGAFP